MKPMTVLHRVRVFVYSRAQGEASYLLLHSAQGLEGLWRPVHGNIEFSEQFETAVRREVLEETGLVNKSDILDLDLPLRQVLGDEEIVHWNFGFPVEGLPASLQLDERYDEYRWAPFAPAFGQLELEGDRAAITRLHSLIHAA